MRAFSLVELSIVLVILGLLTGGILSGQSLIRAAELRSVVTEMQRYQAAIHTFTDKYFALPGDMRNATQFWGKNETACSSHDGSSKADAGTCNGNGDGLIQFSTAAGLTSEAFQAWKQLSLAGLIEGNYTGLAGPINASDYDFGINSPVSKLSNAGWGLSYHNNSAGGNNYSFPYNYQNSMVIGADDNTFADYPVLRTDEAWNVDTKLDDGKPAYGKVHSNTGCTNAGVNTNLAAEYLLTDSAIRCSLAFRHMN